MRRRKGEQSKEGLWSGTINPKVAHIHERNLKSAYDRRHNAPTRFLYHHVKPPVASLVKGSHGLPPTSKYHRVLPMN